MRRYIRILANEINYFLYTFLCSLTTCLVTHWQLHKYSTLDGNAYTSTEILNPGLRDTVSLKTVTDLLETSSPCVDKTGFEEDCTDSESDQGILCNDEDYETAEIIGNRLLLHMAAAFRLIDGDKQDVVPEIKPLDQRRVLFEQLKGEYSLGELISEAKSQGVSRSSAIRWNNQWIEQGLINKENHGNYRKVAWNFETLELWWNFITCWNTADWV